MIYNSLYTEFYRPFRNKIRNLNIYRALYVLWSYSENITHKKQFANDIVPIDNFHIDDKIIKRRSLSEWDIEDLASEIIKYASLKKFTKLQLENPKNMVIVVNKLKLLQNEISGKYIYNCNIEQELFRLAHKEFPWQIDPPNETSLVKYYILYSNKDIKTLIYKQFKLSLDSIFLIAGALWGKFLKAFSSELPLQSNLPYFTIKDIEQFLSIFSKSLDEIRKDTPNITKLDANYFYNMSILRTYPLIQIQFDQKQFLTCPIPTLLIWRITTAIYYDLLMKDIKENTNFSNLIGISFQNYIGKVLYQINLDNHLHILHDKDYYVGTNKKSTIDWIVYDCNAALFIECKTKRITKDSKQNLDASENLDHDLKIIADELLQIYKSIIDYRKNYYPNLKFNKNLKTYPILLTLENLFLFTDEIYNQIHEKLLKLFSLKGMDTEIINECPVTFCSSNEFEILMDVVYQKNISLIFEEKNKNLDTRKISLEIYLYSHFRNEVENNKDPLFPELFKKIFRVDEIEKRILNNSIS